MRTLRRAAARCQGRVGLRTSAEVISVASRKMEVAIMRGTGPELFEHCPDICPNIVRTRGSSSAAKGELMRKHLMAVLSVLGLAGSSMPAQAQQDAKDKTKDAKTASKQK